MDPKVISYDRSHLLPDGAYDIYIEGLQAIMEKRGVDLDTAKGIALDDAIKQKGFEHLNLIEGAYKKLKEGE